MTAKAKKIISPKLKLDIKLDSLIVKVGIIIAFVFICDWMMKPVTEMTPQRDSGAFLYIGQNWLKGMIPYRDMWDHKGPLLYLLNAIGIFISGMKGVMLLQALLTSLGFFYLFRTLCNYINQIAALLIALTGFFILFFLHQSGNQTEQWAIFFEGLALFLFFNNYEGKGILKSWMGVGFLMACSFLLRPNQVALWIVMALYELIILITKQQSLKTFLLKTAYGLCGFLIPVLLFCAYFLYHHAFDEMIDCVFTFNFIYTGNSNTSLLENVKAGISAIPGIWIVLFCMAFNLVLYIVKYKETDKKQWLLFLFAVAWLKLEMVLSTMAGTGHVHYYMQWILALLMLFGSFIFSLKLLIGKKQYLIYGQITATLVLASILYYGFKTKHATDMAAVESYKEKSMYREQMAEIISNNTNDTDYVLEWGIVDGLNFMIERRSPTRYFYPYALDTKGYTSEARVAEFMREVKLHKPKYIVDFSRMERFPSVFPAYRDPFYKAKPELKGQIPANISAFFEYVKEHYETDDGKGDIKGSALILKRLD